MDKDQNQKQGAWKTGEPFALLHSEFGLFFLDLSNEEREELLAGKNPLWGKAFFPAGSIIFNEGDESTELYLVIDGSVEIFKRVGNEGAKVLAVLNKGSIFGEGSLLSSLQRSGSARAIENSDVLVLPRDKFKEFVKEQPEKANFLLLGLLRVINQRLMLTNEELVTVYDMAQIVSSFKDDTQGVMSKLAEKLEAVTLARSGAILLINRMTGVLDVTVDWGDFALTDKEKSDFGGALLTDRVKRVGGNLLVGIHDLEGSRLGLIVLKKDNESEWRLEQEKVAEVIADHLGIALADQSFLQQEKDRSKLKRENIQF